MQPLDKLTLRKGSCQSGYLFALMEDHERRNGTNLELSRRVRISFRIEFEKAGLFAKLSGHLRENRCKLLTRTTPRCPEIYDNRQAGIVNVAPEILVVHGKRLAAQQGLTAFAAQGAGTEFLSRYAVDCRAGRAD